MSLEESMKRKIRDIPDYPKKGIIFRDITPLLKDSVLFSACVDEIAKEISGLRPDYIVGIEARGFIIGSVIAYKLGVGFVPARKKGKLPHEKISVSYELEYGQETIELHKDAVEKDSKVVIVDDLLATGGTTLAAIKLVRQIGAEVVGLAYLVELTKLKGREHLPVENVISLAKY
jgi:adenine phosphoribosyltransferase